MRSASCARICAVPWSCASDFTSAAHVVSRGEFSFFAAPIDEERVRLARAAALRDRERVRAERQLVVLVGRERRAVGLLRAGEIAEVLFDDAERILRRRRARIEARRGLELLLRGREIALEPRLPSGLVRRLRRSGEARRARAFDDADLRALLVDDGRPRRRVVLRVLDLLVVAAAAGHEHRHDARGHERHRPSQPPLAAPHGPSFLRRFRPHGPRVEDAAHGAAGSGMAVPFDDGSAARPGLVWTY